MSIAILGAGLFAKEAHLPALYENHAKVVAVYSRSSKSANELVKEAEKLDAAAAKGMEVYSDDTAGHGLDDLLKRKDIAGVVVALPILVQPDVVRKCLAAGKHVLCEKPIAKDVESAVSLIKEYEAKYQSKNLIFSIAEQFRYDLCYEKARQVIAKGDIGKVASVHARVWGNIQPGQNKWYETEWRKIPEYQGGFILDGGVHFIALIRHVSGQEIIETNSFAMQTYDHLPPVDTVNAALRFSGGALGSLSLSFASVKGNFEFIFVGTSGSLTISGADGGNRLVVEDAEGKVKSDEIIAGKGVFEEVRAFIEAVKTGKADEKAGPRQALADLAVIETVAPIVVILIMQDPELDIASLLKDINDANTALDGLEAKADALNA
ncbi:hypothetical protein BZG36_04480, partial [Bifiguratus adelaidae]